MIYRIRRDLRQNNFDYKITDKKSFTHKHYNKTIYNGPGSIFFLTSKEELFALFVVENGKLYSFCIDVYLSPKKDIVPYFFFDKTKL